MIHDPHQCECTPTDPATHWFMTGVDAGGDGRFPTWTNLSKHPDAKSSCGAGDGNLTLISLLSGVRRACLRLAAHRIKAAH